MKAKDIIERLRELDADSERGPEVAWGDPGLDAERLVVTWSADVESLEAIARLPGASVVLTRSHPFFAPPVGFDPAIVPSRDGWAELIEGDVVAAAKRALLADREVVLVTAPWLWDGAGAGARSRALSARLALGATIADEGSSVIVSLDAPSTVSELSRAVVDRLGGGHVLVLGGSDRPIRRAVIAAGVVTPLDLAIALRDPLVDVVIAGEVIEWEAGPYIEDVIAGGRELTLIAVGNAVSENPASEALARWLEDDRIGIPVVFLPTSQSAWVVKGVGAR